MGSSSGPPTQIGMDHIALDGTGPDQGHFHHQIVEFSRFQPGQHGHLGPGLHLEDAHGVSPAQHRIHRRILRRDVLEAEGAAPPPGNRGQGAADGREHAQGQDIHLHETDGVEVVLIPLNDAALGHGGILDGHQAGQGAPGDDETAHVLGQVPGESHAGPRPGPAIWLTRGDSGSRPSSAKRSGSCSRLSHQARDAVRASIWAMPKPRARPASRRAPLVR